MCNFRFFNRSAAKITFFFVLLVISASGVIAKTQIARPFESDKNYIPANDIDKLIIKTLRKKGIEPANLCSDEVFIRRVYLDLNGLLPRADQVRVFLKDKNLNKRSVLIDKLLDRKEFSEYWSLKWCDLLRVKSEYPINLWPNAVQAYHRWIQECLKNNMHYDKFARELLTSSGSNFRVPEVNFYRAIQGQEPGSIASAVALTFMGVRFDNLDPNFQAGLKDLFSRVEYKKTAEWKEEIVCLDPSQNTPFKAVMPDGSIVCVKADSDPRAVFADWLITGQNRWFAKNIVNRIWSWLFGRGIIEPADDIRQDNPPVYPDVLEYLEKELVKNHYDLKHIYRLILNSRTYQQSSIPVGNDDTQSESFFACYPVRQLDAEVLIDILSDLFGSKEHYSSLTPEPYTFIPPEDRSIDLADGSISSEFLEMFGRPSRDTGLMSERSYEPTDSQRLHMLNSTHIQENIKNSWRLRGLIKAARGKTYLLINMAYLNILSRYPTQSELSTVEKYFKTSGIAHRQATDDLVWSLINTKEFSYRH